MKKTLSFILALVMVAAMFAVVAMPASAADAAVASDVWDGTADTSWYDASKTEFTLTTAEQLAGLAKLVNEGTAADKPFNGVTIKLGANMVLNEGTFAKGDDFLAPLYNGNPVGADNQPKEWTPIGVSANDNNEAKVLTNSSFWGAFDGCGYTISGMYINQPSKQQMGLFAGFAGTEIKNVNITNSYVLGNSRSGSLIGVISHGDANNSRDVLVENITSSAIVVSYSDTNNSRCGGIFGMARRIKALTVKNVEFSGALYVYSAKGVTTFARYFGGVIGVTVDDEADSNTTLDGVKMTGSIYSYTSDENPETGKGSSVYIGGIIGNFCKSTATMKNCVVDIKETNITPENGFKTAEGSTKGMETSISALAGYYEGATTIVIENCSWAHKGSFVYGVGYMSKDDTTVNGETKLQWTNKPYGDIPGATNHTAAADSFKPATPHTCTQNGTISYSFCETCGCLINKDMQSAATVIDPAACTLGELVTGTPATCTEAGTVDHYECSVCHKLYDADKNEIASIDVPAGHTLGEWVDAVDPTTEAAGVLGHYQCEVCEKYFDADKNELASIEGAAKLTTPAETTAAPAETTAAPDEGGCGGFTAIGAVLALIALTGAAVVIKKK